MENKKTSIFDGFIGKYELSKTIRFELKPVARTAELLKENKVFEKDQTIDNSYNQAKFYFDEMHREFINNALVGLPASILDPLKNAFLKKMAQDKNIDKREFNKEWKKARKLFCEEIADIFDQKAREIEEKDGIEKKKTVGVKYLLSAKILNHLKLEFSKEKSDQFEKDGKPSLFTVNLATGEKQYIFDSFDRFSTYLGKFQETKNNLYTSDDKATSVASRIIDNFVIFWSNKNKFESKLNAIAKEAGFSEEEKKIFQQSYYITCFIQAGISKYNENTGNLNKKIKEFRDKEQKKAKENKQEFKKGNYPLLVELDKQILSYVEKEKELINGDEDLEKVFGIFVEENTKKFERGLVLMNDLCSGKFSAEYDRIYLQKKVINTISRKWFTDSNAFELLLPQTADNKDKSLANIKKYISLADIKKALEKEESGDGLSGDIFKDRYYENKSGAGINRGATLTERFGQFLQIWLFEFENLFKDKELTNDTVLRGYEFHNVETKNINWSNLSREIKKESSDKYRKEVERIKQYADASLLIYQMLKYFVLGAKDAPVGSDFFYGEFNDYYQDFAFIRYYDALRNYITKKTFSPEKIKLNFENGQFLSGFDKNKEKEKFGVIFRKGKSYYLGVLIDKYKNIFDDYESHSGGSSYEKMEYKLFPDPKRMIPKIAFAAKNEAIFGLTEKISKIKEEYEKFQKEKSDRDNWKKIFDRKKCSDLIEYYQKCLEIGGYKQQFNLIWKKSKEYSGIGEFNDDILRQNYKVSFKKVSSEYIDNAVRDGKMYLFKIYNKDFSEYSKGKGKNIHSLYFLNLFTTDNLKSPVLKLSGGAEVFLRRKSDDLSPKNDNTGKTVIDHKRYSEDKILFHIPIKINRGQNKAYNKQINLLLAKNKALNIIGIDRGEKNLLYYSVINQRSEILEQGSLNEINGVNYFDKLNQREKKREADRKSWNQIDQIKDLKRGYLSGVVHKICSLIIKYDAIVVLEDLNMRFKQVRGGIEKSVYQQFEKTLIDKLGYMVFKDRDPLEAGGVLKGYQLAAPFESFDKMLKQTGILFYTQADYTSITDPVTGFRKNVYIGNSWSTKKIKEAVDKFKSIKWDNKIGAYAFTYNTGDFSYVFSSRNKKNNRKIKETAANEWTVYSSAPRLERFRNEVGYWECNLINLTKAFD
jgi:CRISPR-associated protein Cpf1